MLIFKIAFRNIFRHKRRSILTGLMMGSGCLLFSVFIGMVDGTYGGIIEMFTGGYTGHVQIHKSGYLDKPSIYSVIKNPGALGQKIEGLPDVKSWAPRVRTPALAFAGVKTSGMEIIGVDPLKEAATTRLKEKIKRGRFISSEPLSEIVLSGSLARVLKVDLGGEVALISQGVDGSVANDLVTVVGIAGGEDGGYGSIRSFMHIGTAQSFMSLEEGVHEIAVVLTDHTKSRQAAAKIEEELKDPSLDVSPWEVVEKQFYRAMRADIEGNWISIFILTIIIAMGVLNTVLMVVLERTREYGVLKAIGTRPRSLFWLIIIETAFLSIISIIAGTALGIVANHLLAVYGIDYPVPLEYGGMTFEKLTAKITPRTIILPGTIVFCTTLLVSLFPAARAARTVPVKALRD